MKNIQYHLEKLLKLKIKRDGFCNFIFCPYKKYLSASDYAECSKFPACMIIKERWFEIPSWVTKDTADGFLLFLYKKELGIK